MHPNVDAVIGAAAERGLTIEPREFPEGTRTADDAARAIGVEAGQIVKSLVFTVSGAVVMALVSGANRLDERLLARAVDGVGGDAARVERADADLVKTATGFPIGGVPPFGHPAVLRTFVDEDLLAYDVVWAAAGTPRHVFPIAPDDLARITAGAIAKLARA
ncbi:MAG: YbaK/EbsC family protein [Acidimicrobiales bacterium]